MSEELTDIEIRGLVDTELCVCHIQNDCPTHPTGDFGKPTNDQINRRIHSLITGGEGHFHKWSGITYVFGVPVRSRCLEEGCGAIKWPQTANPDYLNSPADRDTLLEFCITKWDRWERFIRDDQGGTRSPFKGGLLIPQSLLHPIDALGRAVCEYLKEKKDA